MKKYFMALCATISLISTLSAFEDKPALGRAERAALITADYVGAAGGVAGGHAAMALVQKLDPKIPAFTLATIALPYSYLMIRSGGYRSGLLLAISVLAKLHGVTYRIEAISQYYNINVSQYKPILTAAATQNPEVLLQAINELYSQRFGQNWKERLEKLFKKYRKRARILSKESSFNKEGNLKDFLRMVELGAAMANLYFGTNPNPEYTINSAIELYQELGLLK